MNKSQRNKIKEIYKNKKRSRHTIRFTKEHIYYPWKNIKVDEYFFVPNNVIKSLKSGRVSIDNSANQQKELYNTKWSVNITDRGLRVLRIA